MNLVRTIVVAVGVVGIGALLYLHRQDLGMSGPHGFGSNATSAYESMLPAEGHPPRISWTAANHPELGFKVEMPADAKQIEVPSYGEKGGSESVNMLYANPDGGTTFAVAWADNPPVVRVNNHAVEQILQAARDGLLERTQTTVINESRSSYGGNPAIDLVARNTGGGIVNARLLYSGNRLYMLVATFPSMGARREQDVLRFYNSFTTSTNSSIPATVPAAPLPDNSSSQ